jgi:prolyl oligopeptidase
VLVSADSRNADSPNADSPDASPGVPEPPATRRQPVTDVYHGVAVADDYRWLEDSHSPEVQAWSAAQNQYARGILDALPGVARIRQQVTQIMQTPTTSFWGVTPAGGRFFAMKHQPPHQQPWLVVTESLDPDTPERVLVDPNELDPSGATSITWYRPSHDGRLVAVSLAQGGDEVGDAIVVNVGTGERLEDHVPRVNTGTAGGDLAWAPDGSGFYYTRHPLPGERAEEDLFFYQQVYFHRLGTAAQSDRYELGKNFPRIAETRLDVDPQTARVLATVQYGDGGQFAHYLRHADGRWEQFSQFGDRIVQAEFGAHEDLYLLSRDGAPRGKILRLPLENLDPQQATTVIPETAETLVESFWGGGTLLPTAGRLYVVYQLGGPSQIRVFDLQGNPLAGPEQLKVASAGGLVSLGGDDVLFYNASYLAPSRYLAFRSASEATTATCFASTAAVSLDDAEVIREFATSPDGTEVPVNILRRRGTPQDGTAPCLATAYGGYGVSLTPALDPLNRLLLDHGFVVAVANVRGGGEYGEAWHLAGNLTHKQNVFDDFSAVLSHLIASGYVSSARLGIVGGSNGGLLMGATLTQHPDLARAVVSYVGIYDSLRTELSPNGEFNITEFGTVKDRDQFEAMYAYSPYHHAAPGTRYPAVLFLTGENDPRVEPMQSRKMAARLQGAQSPGAQPRGDHGSGAGDAWRPILLRTSAGTGHGGDTPLDERIEQEVDAFSFLFHALGVAAAGGGGGGSDGAGARR